MYRPTRVLPLVKPWPYSPRRGAVRSVAMLVLLGALCSVAVPSGAAGPTWIWLDDAGRRVYSDQPPPTNLPPKRLLQAGSPRAPLPEPPAEAAAPAGTGPAAATTPAATAAPGTPAPGGARPAQAPAAETPQQAAQRRAVETRNAEIRADNCQRAQAAMTTLRSNARLLVTNAEGRQVPMDASSRQAEMARLEQIIGANCN